MPSKKKIAPLDPVYDLVKASELTGLAVVTLRKMIADGRLAVIRPAGTNAIRVTRSEIERLRRGDPPVPAA
jgi:excisionase family DNA binding protein